MCESTNADTSIQVTKELSCRTSYPSLRARRAVIEVPTRTPVATRMPKGWSGSGPMCRSGTWMYGTMKRRRDVYHKRFTRTLGFAPSKASCPQAALTSSPLRLRMKHA